MTKYFLLFCHPWNLGNYLEMILRYFIIIRGASISSITGFLQYTGELLKSYSISTVLLEGKFWGRNIRENSHKYIYRKERNILCFLLGTREVWLELTFRCFSLKNLLSYYTFFKRTSKNWLSLICSEVFRISVFWWS